MATPYKAAFIKVPVAEGSFQTMPTEPEKRLRDDEIRVEKCTEADSREIAEGFYKTFPPAFFDKMEPPHLRPPSDETRIARLAKRLQPTMSEPLVCWTKAVHVPSNTIVGAAGWNAPGLPLLSVLCRPAVAFYGFQERMGWSDEEVEEMWAHVDDEQWNGQFAADDEHRKKLLGDTPHWYLAPLYTLPEFQGRGVGMKLMKWAIEQADATDPPTPMYLESAPSARAVYLHCGFEAPEGEPKTMIRWGTKKVGTDGEDGKGKGVGEKATVVSVDVMAKEMEAELAH